MRLPALFLIVIFYLSLVAVEVKAESQTPSATVSPNPALTATPMVTTTPSPTATAMVATATPVMTKSPTPSPTVNATVKATTRPTALVTARPVASATVQATATPIPTRTPEPTFLPIEFGGQGGNNSGSGPGQVAAAVDADGPTNVLTHMFVVLLFLTVAGAGMAITGRYPSFIKAYFDKRRTPHSGRRIS